MPVQPDTWGALGGAADSNMGGVRMDQVQLTAATLLQDILNPPVSPAPLAHAVAVAGPAANTSQPAAADGAAQEQLLGAAVSSRGRVAADAPQAQLVPKPALAAWYVHSVHSMLVGLPAVTVFVVGTQRHISLACPLLPSLDQCAQQ